MKYLPFCGLCRYSAFLLCAAERSDKNYLSGCSAEFFVGSFLATRRNTLCISRDARSESGEKEPEKPKENFLSCAQQKNYRIANRLGAMRYRGISYVHLSLRRY